MQVRLPDIFCRILGSAVLLLALAFQSPMVMLSNSEAMANELISVLGIANAVECCTASCI